MKEFFEKVLSENAKYVEMVERKDTEQVKQLEKCKALFEAVKVCGWLNEYSEYCKNRKA